MILRPRKEVSNLCLASVVLAGTFFVAIGCTHASENDEVKRQLAMCWNVPMGGPAINESVAVSLDIATDGTIQNADIVDQDRMNTDPYFRSVANSIMRAVHNPKCSPLKLPAGQYNEWKHLYLNFNVRDML